MSEVREPIDTEIDAVDVRELTDMELDTCAEGATLIPLMSPIFYTRMLMQRAVMPRASD